MGMNGKGLCRRWKRHPYNPSKAKEEEFAKAKGRLAGLQELNSIHLGPSNFDLYGRNQTSSTSSQTVDWIYIGSRK